jgi:hypothetical protein
MALKSKPGTESHTTGRSREQGVIAALAFLDEQVAILH